MYVYRIRKGFSYILALNILQFAIGLIFYAVIAKILTQADLGVISTLTFFYATFTVIAPFALHVSGTKYISEFLGKNELDKAADVGSTVIKLILRLSIVFLTFFSIISFFLSTFYQSSNALVFLIITFVASFIATIRITYLAQLQGLQLFDKHAISSTFSIIISRLASLFLIILGAGLLGFALGILLGETVGLALTFFYCHGSLPKSKGKYDSKLLFKFSFPVYMMMIVIVLSEWVDRILFLGVSSDLKALGIYELAIRGVGVLTIVWATIDVVILPVFSETFGRIGETALTPLLKKAIRYLAFMFFPAALGLASISKTVMLLLFGLAYAEGSLPLMILSISSIFTAFSTVMGSTLKSIGETSVFVKISIISIVVDSFLVITLVPLYGILGAIIGKVASALTSFVYVSLELKSKIRLEIDKDGFWKGVSASILIAIMLRLFESYLYSFNSALTFIFEIVLGILCYFFVLTLLKALKKEDFQILRRIMPKHLTKFLDVFERLLVH